MKYHTISVYKTQKTVKNLFIRFGGVWYFIYEWKQNEKHGGT